MSVRVRPPVVAVLAAGSVLRCPACMTARRYDGGQARDADGLHTQARTLPTATANEQQRDPQVRDVDRNKDSGDKRDNLIGDRLP
jgi:hypothetical protein